ncbi:unnamed protein product [Macrosiphum euphorbiae]|uniref:Uncharacterized protein n=1 Tax=Macrosiphum euphorbiae TaxID=13131 RepID=A0AAV0WD89_9HEMI|nr:unnamed protein product [Macrosiphum euphorbiae]
MSRSLAEHPTIITTLGSVDVYIYECIRPIIISNSPIFKTSRLFKIHSCCHLKTEKTTNRRIRTTRETIPESPKTPPENQLRQPEWRYEYPTVLRPQCGAVTLSNQQRRAIQFHGIPKTAAGPDYQKTRVLRLIKTNKSPPSAPA